MENKRNFRKKAILRDVFMLSFEKEEKGWKKLLVMEMNIKGRGLFTLPIMMALGRIYINGKMELTLKVLQEVLMMQNDNC